MFMWNINCRGICQPGSLWIYTVVPCPALRSLSIYTYANRPSLLEILFHNTTLKTHIASHSISHLLLSFLTMHLHPWNPGRATGPTSAAQIPRQPLSSKRSRMSGPSRHPQIWICSGISGPWPCWSCWSWRGLSPPRRGFDHLHQPRRSLHHPALLQNFRPRNGKSRSDEELRRRAGLRADAGLS